MKSTKHEPNITPISCTPIISVRGAWIFMRVLLSSIWVCNVKKRKRIEVRQIHTFHFGDGFTEQKKRNMYRNVYRSQPRLLILYSSASSVIPSFIWLLGNKPLCEWMRECRARHSLQARRRHSIQNSEKHVTRDCTQKMYTHHKILKWKKSHVFAVLLRN
jgi:hypothetical protein